MYGNRWRPFRVQRSHSHDKGGEHDQNLARRVWWVTILLVAVPSVAFGQVVEDDIAVIVADLVRSELDSVRIYQRGFFWVTPLVILISAVLAGFWAHRSIQENKKIARQRATFDYLSRLSWDQDWIEMRKTYLALKAGDTKLRAIADKYEHLKEANTVEGATEEAKQQRDELIAKHSAIKNILNEYEAVAIGIDTGTLDEEIIKRNSRQAIMDTVDTCKEFIEVTRKNTAAKDGSKLYIECQEMVNRWRSG